MGKRKARNNLEDAVLMNNATYFDYLERFKRIALSMFEWTNLPDSMDARYLERCLYYTGQAAMLYLEPYGFINTKSATSGKLNLYGLPTRIRCYSYGEINTSRRVFNGVSEAVAKINGYEDDTDDDRSTEAILVLNNWEGVATATTVELFAMRMAIAERAIDVNIRAQKTPFMVVTNDNERLSMMNALDQVEKNAMALVVERNHFDPESFKTLETQAPYVADKLTDYKCGIWNEFLTFLGVDNISEKRERMISAETMSNNECVNLNMMASFKTREKAAKEFNQKYGKNVEVKLRSDVYNIIKSTESVIVDSLKGENLETIEKMEVANG
jgi:hypothetical protein